MAKLRALFLHQAESTLYTPRDDDFNGSQGSAKEISNFKVHRNPVRLARFYVIEKRWLLGRECWVVI